MKDGEQPSSVAWRRRRGLTTDCLALWTAHDWFTWFADGLDIWFSELPRADREFAFAPLGIVLGRERMADSLADYLDRVCRHARAAADNLELRERIQAGGIACFRNAVVMHSPQRATFLLDAFTRWKARSLPIMARLSIQRMLELVDPLGRADGEAYLSLLCYVIFDNEVIGEKDVLAGPLETLLSQSRNFRPALAYSLRLPWGDVETALATFYRLTRASASFSDDRVWRVAAEEFDRVFGRETVADTLKAIIESSSTRGFDAAEALVPAARLEEFYAPSRKNAGTGLFALAIDGDGFDNTEALSDRGIGIDDREKVEIAEEEDEDEFA